jgi:hypothetical protein
MRYGSIVIGAINHRRRVSYEDGAKFAKDNNLFFLEISAKTAYQVDDVPVEKIIGLP